MLNTLLSPSLVAVALSSLLLFVAADSSDASSHRSPTKSAPAKEPGKIEFPNVKAGEPKGTSDGASSQGGGKMHLEDLHAKPERK